MTLTPTFLKDYTALPYRITHAHLTFELDPDRTLVHSKLTIIPTELSNNESIVLNGENLELVSITLNGRPVAYSIHENLLQLPGITDSSEIHICTAIAPKLNTELDGLYWVNNTFCTQNEPEGFRKITYFIDRPDNLTIFTTTIIANPVTHPHQLSNGNKIQPTHLNDGRIGVTWHDPFPKPSYLYALVAGNFDCISDQFITQSGRTIQLEIYSDPGFGDRCRYAMGALKRSMKWDEEKYGREYDLDQFMIVAIDSFNMGAMENKGLNIFNSAYILADPLTATDTDYMNIEAVVAHEYFHNWTGNRITCRDWFQLTLKEGLTVYRDQEFSSDINSRGVKRIADVRLIKESQFTEDAGPMAHPIQPKSYLEINNFYTSTIYNKGAEVIRMMATLASPDGFRKGTDLYFDRHDGQAVTTEEFVVAIENGASIDLTQFRRWYHQAGTPEVTITPTIQDDQIIELTISQTCRPTPESEHKLPFVIPLGIAFFNPQGQPIPFSMNDGPRQTEQMILVSDAVSAIKITMEGTHNIPSLLRNFTAPVRLSYPYKESDLLILLAHDTDPVSKYEAAQQLFETAILRHYHTPSEALISIELENALRQLILDTQIDPAETATYLQIPTLNHLLNLVPNFPIEALHQIRTQLITEIATRFEPILINRYHTLNTTPDYEPTPVQIGQRRLKNCILSILSDSQAGLELAKSQFQSANNMTDQFAALVCITHSTVSGHDATSELTQFYDQWKNDPLVINKWLSAQASSAHPSTPQIVNTLLSHPSFNRLIPNQFRALVGTFSANAIHFHQADGTGYQWVVKQISELDEYNPQIAARIALAFQRTARCNLQRRILIDALLTQILSSSKISKNLFEVVSKIKGSYNLEK